MLGVCPVNQLLVVPGTDARTVPFHLALGTCCHRSATRWQHVLTPPWSVHSGVLLPAGAQRSGYCLTSHGREEASGLEPRAPALAKTRSRLLGAGSLCAPGHRGLDSAAGPAHLGLWSASTPSARREQCTKQGASDLEHADAPLQDPAPVSDSAHLLGEGVACREGGMAAGSRQGQGQGEGERLLSMTCASSSSSHTCVGAHTGEAGDGGEELGTSVGRVHRRGEAGSDSCRLWGTRPQPLVVFPRGWGPSPNAWSSEVRPSCRDPLG